MPYIWTNLNLIHPRTLCTKFCWNWFGGSWVNFLKIFLQCTWHALFRYYLPLEKDGALQLNKLEFPSPKNALWQVWLKFVLWFWRRRSLKVVNEFPIFLNYLCLEKDGSLHLNKPKNALCHVWLKLAQWFWRRRSFNFVNISSLTLTIQHIFLVFLFPAQNLCFGNVRTM